MERGLPSRGLARRQAAAEGTAHGPHARPEEALLRAKAHLHAGQGQGIQVSRRHHLRNPALRQLVPGLRLALDSKWRRQPRRVRLHPGLAEPQARGKAPEILGVRLPRAELLPSPQGSRVLREGHQALPRQQEGQDLHGPLAAGSEPVTLSRALRLLAAQRGGENPHGPQGARWSQGDGALRPRTAGHDPAQSRGVQPPLRRGGRKLGAGDRRQTRLACPTREPEQASGRENAKAIGDDE